MQDTDMGQCAGHRHRPIFNYAVCYRTEVVFNLGIGGSFDASPKYIATGFYILAAFTGFIYTYIFRSLVSTSFLGRSFS